MPKYKYKASDENGKKVSGVINAADEAELQLKLKAEDKYFISAKEIKDKKQSRTFNSKKLSDFSRQIGTLTGSGVSLVRALRIIAQEEALSDQEKKVYEQLFKLIRQGVALSDAMEMQGKAFPTLMIQMYRSAEASGTLDQTALRMADYFTKEHILNSKVKSSMIYPKILLALLVAVIVIIMTFVMPRFESMFAKMESLPLATRALMAFSDLLVGYWWLLAVGAVGLMFAYRALMEIPTIRTQRDRLMVHLPLIGKLQKTICTARFARTLSSLYSAGIPIVTTLQISRKTIGNDYIEQQFDSVIAAVRSGQNLSDQLDTIDGFVKKMPSSVRIGEETGKMDSMLDSIADMLDHESQTAVSKMVSYLEPVMIIFMAIVVAIVVIAVIIPIYNSYGTIGT